MCCSYTSTRLYNWILWLPELIQTTTSNTCTATQKEEQQPFDSRTMGRKRKADSIPDFSLKLEGGEDGQPLAKDAREDDPAQRNTANARERDRMRVLSKAFTKLKTTLPWVPPDTKLSKLDTLKLASCYIAHLRQILDEDNTENSPVMAGIATRNLKSNSNLHPMTLTWPFTFNGRTSVCDNGYDTGTKSMSVNKHS